MLVENRAIDLIPGQVCLVEGSEFPAAAEVLHARACEPEAKPLFDNVVVVEMGCQAKVLGQKISAHLGRGFPDLPVKFPRPLDDGHAEFRPLALEQKRRGRTGKRPPDHNHIMRAVHPAHSYPTTPMLAI